MVEFFGMVDSDTAQGMRRGDYSKLDHDLPAFPGNSHAHIYSGYALHVDNGLWVRLNPDQSYVEDIFSQEGLAVPATFVENDANLPKATVQNQMHDLAAPDATEHYWLYLAASLNELADRQQDGNFSSDLTFP